MAKGEGECRQVGEGAREPRRDREEARGGVDSEPARGVGRSLLIDGPERRVSLVLGTLEVGSGSCARCSGGKWRVDAKLGLQITGQNARSTCHGTRSSS